MKDYDGLIIKKGGKLIDSKWDKDLGEHVEKDVTEIAAMYLFDHCVLEAGVTLRDIFLLIKANMDVLKVILGNWVDEIVDEGLNGIPKEEDPNDKYFTDYLELYWVLTRVRKWEAYKDGPKLQPKGSIYAQIGNGYKDGEFTGPITLSGYLRPDFHAMSRVQTEDGDPMTDAWKKGERIPLSLSFTPSCDIIDKPVILNQDICICDDVVNHDWSKDNTIVYDACEYSLGHILNGIIWELSFHGSPKKRTDQKEELNEILKEFEESKKND